MALQMTKTTRHGFVAENAYHRVEQLTITNKNSLQFIVKSYKDASVELSFNDSSYDAEYDIQGDNPIRQAYKHLKTLPEFSGATDC